MFTASLKKRENIAEYLLYMWNIEDLIRASQLDIDNIDKNIIGRYTGLDEVQKKELHEWYESLIDMMKREGVSEAGHLQINKNIIIQLDDLHRQLLSDPKFHDYKEAFYAALPYIVELRSKAGENKVGEIETCFNALFGIMMLGMSGKEISQQTKDASSRISRFLALLSKYYRLEYNNELKFTE